MSDRRVIYAECLNVRTSKERVLKISESRTSESSDWNIILNKDITIGYLRGALLKISNEMHLLDTSPCKTCEDITGILGEPFGCVAYQTKYQIQSEHPSNQGVRLSAPENILSIRAKRAIAEAENLKNRMKVLADQMDEYIEKLGKD